MKPFLKDKKTFFLILFSIFLFLFSFSVQAQVEGQLTNFVTNTPLIKTDLVKLIFNIIRYVLTFLGVVAIVILIYGGFTWLTAAGNTEKVAKAKKILINGLIGLVVVLLSYTIVSFVTGQLIKIAEPPACNLDNVGVCSNCYRCTDLGAGVYQWIFDSTCNPAVCVSLPPPPVSQFMQLVHKFPTGTDAILCWVVQATFSENLNCDTVNTNNIKLKIKNGASAGVSCTENKGCASGVCSGGICQGDQIEGNFECLNNTNAFSFDPRNDYEQFTTYEIEITSGLRSVTGRSLLPSQRKWEFVTGDQGDTVPPTVILVYPTAGSNGVCRLAPIQAKFSEVMKTTTLCQVNNDDSADNSVNTNPSYNNFSCNIPTLDSFSAQPEPKIPYDGDTLYTATLNSAVIKDACNIPLADDYSWSFTTHSTKTECKPQIDSITGNPYYGEELSITGTDFTITGNVIFSRHLYSDAKCFDTNYLPNQNCLTSWTGNQIKVKIPAANGDSNGAVSGPIQLRIGDVCYSNPFNFNILSPYIESINPNSGGKGQVITINGRNFGTTAEIVSFVKTEPYSRTDAVLPCGPVGWQNDKIIIQVPSGLANGHYLIQVKDSNGRYSNLGNFEINNNPAGPVLCDLTPRCPNNQIGGKKDDSRTLSGSGLANTDKIYFDNIEANCGPVSPTGTTPPQSRSCTVPNLSTKTYSVRVKDTGGNYSNPLNFISPCQQCPPVSALAFTPEMRFLASFNNTLNVLTSPGITTSPLLSENVVFEEGRFAEGALFSSLMRYYEPLKKEKILTKVINERTYYFYPSAAFDRLWHQGQRQKSPNDSSNDWCQSNTIFFWLTPEGTRGNMVRQCSETLSGPNGIDSVVTQFNQFVDWNDDKTPELERGLYFLSDTDPRLDNRTYYLHYRTNDKPGVGSYDLYNVNNQPLFDPQRGTIMVWVRPTWDSNDGPGGWEGQILNYGSWWHRERPDLSKDWFMFAINATGNNVRLIIYRAIDPGRADYLRNEITSGNSARRQAALEEVDSYRAHVFWPINWRAGQWYHLALTFNRSIATGNVELFLNGISQGKRTIFHDAWFMNLQGDVRVRIGHNIGATLDEMAIFQNPVSADEIYKIGCSAREIEEPLAYLDSLNPDNGIAQTAKTTIVTIRGRNFGRSPGRVFFGGIETFSTPCGKWSENEIIVPAPAGLTGTVQVRVETRAGLSSNTKPFVVNNISRPGICSINPSAGLEGTSVIVSGRNFTNDRKPPTVDSFVTVACRFLDNVPGCLETVNEGEPVGNRNSRFKLSSDSQILSWTDQQITVLMPQKVRTGDLRVSVDYGNAGGRRASNPITFTSLILCGNGQIDAGEQCDPGPPENLGGKTCATIAGGFIGGTLACQPNCTFDTTGCFKPGGQGRWGDKCKLVNVCTEGADNCALAQGATCVQNDSTKPCACCCDQDVNPDTCTLIHSNLVCDETKTCPGPTGQKGRCCGCGTDDDKCCASPPCIGMACKDNCCLPFPAPTDLQIIDPNIERIKLTWQYQDPENLATHFEIWRQVPGVTGYSLLTTCKIDGSACEPNPANKFSLTSVAGNYTFIDATGGFSRELYSFKVRAKKGTNTAYSDYTTEVSGTPVGVVGPCTANNDCPSKTPCCLTAGPNQGQCVSVDLCQAPNCAYGGLCQPLPAPFALADFRVEPNLPLGACLIKIEPRQGEINTNVLLEGRRFTNTGPPNNKVTFADKLGGRVDALYTDPLIWTDNSIEKARVPSDADDGEVKVVVNNIESNGLWFDFLPVLVGPGEKCHHSTCPLEPGVCAPNPPYSCLVKVGGTDCRCCCQPGSNVCQNLNSRLSCEANRGNCTGANRGLCCGCKDDADCGGILGCAILETEPKCCYARPRVESVNPADGSQNVCLNTAVEITFSQLMDFERLTINQIYLRRPGSCESGDEEGETKVVNRANQWSRLFSRFIPTALGAENGNGPDSSQRWCYIFGRLVSTNIDTNNDGIKDKTKVVFFPKKCRLQPSTNYEIKIIGGLYGVRSDKGVAMVANFDSSFMTGESTSFCSVDYIQVAPQDTTLTETGATQKYFAFSYTNDRKLLVCVPGYSWSSSNDSLATVSPLVDLETTATVVSTNQSGQTIIKAETSGKSCETAPGYCGLLKVHLGGPLVVEDENCKTQTQSPTPWMGSTDACVNALVSARFNQEMNTKTLTTDNILVKSCGSTDPFINPAANNCTVNVLGTIIEDATQRFKFKPTNNFSPNTWYQVTLKDNITSTGGLKLDGDKDKMPGGDYTWYFKTRSSNELCPLASVVVSPSNSHLVHSGAGVTADFSASAQAANCNLINSDPYPWQWSKSVIESFPVPVTSVFPVFRVLGKNNTTCFSHTDCESNDCRCPVGGGFGCFLKRCLGGLPSNQARIRTTNLGQADLKATASNKTGQARVVVATPPAIIERKPANGATNVCLNAVLSVKFDQLMDRDSLNNQTIILQKGIWVPGDDPGNGGNGGGGGGGGGGATFFLDKFRAAAENGSWDWRSVNKELIISDIANQTLVTLKLNNVLEKNTDYRIVVLGGASGVKSKKPYDRSMTGNSSWQFKTGNQICHLDRVEIEPARHTFTKLVAPDNPINVKAKALASNNQEIQEVLGVYEWTWHDQDNEPKVKWHSTDESIATVTNSDSENQVVTAQNKNGQTFISATAKITLSLLPDSDENDLKTGYSQITVFLCENPWPNPPPYQDQDPNNTNFQFQYCRDKGIHGTEDDLPALIGGPVPGPGELDKIKEFLFTTDYLFCSQTKTKRCKSDAECPTGEECNYQVTDAIGIKVFSNRDHLSPQQWFERYAPGAKAGTAAVVVDGYQAVKVGRTTYVSAANVVGDRLHTNIYLISHNDGAQPETMDIFNQLVKNWQFNSNVIDDVFKDKLRRDVLRLTHLNEIFATLEEYKKKKGHYPKLEAGTYLKGLAVSKWPSWTKEGLGLELTQAGLKPLPVDPINKFANRNNCSDAAGNYACCANCPRNNPQCDETCYNPKTKNYERLDGSYVYEYRTSTTSPGLNYEVYLQMEAGLLNPGSKFWDHQCSNNPKNICEKRAWCYWDSYTTTCKPRNFKIGGLNTFFNSKIFPKTAFQIVGLKNLNLFPTQKKENSFQLLLPSGLTGNITFSVEGLPANVSITPITPCPATLSSCSKTFTLEADANAGPGDFTIEIVGIHNDLAVNSGSFQLTVKDQDTILPVAEIISPAAGSWQSNYFIVRFKFSDEGGAGLKKCEFRVESQGSETIPWTSLGECSGNGPLIRSRTIKVTGVIVEPDIIIEGVIVEVDACRHYGENKCRVEIRAEDAVGNKSSVVGRNFSIR